MKAKWLKVEEEQDLMPPVFKVRRQYSHSEDRSNQICISISK